MDKKIIIKIQIEELREILNNKLLNNIRDKNRNDLDTIHISCKLDKLIVEYMNTIDKE
ncbi:MAG: Spo0E family sporulation regulatory protein-aspartic acid phosphatase [Candidatus Methanofastidiosa archaeon]|nr:Spo0E family sporulation regulatory protein-aspartic acid phosphatase [Candidatus Methanofastidiosa archaeon]